MGNLITQTFKGDKYLEIQKCLEINSSNELKLTHYFYSNGLILNGIKINFVGDIVVCSGNKEELDAFEFVTFYNLIDPSDIFSPPKDKGEFGYGNDSKWKKN
jgi:hypothetical protein